MIKVCDAIMGSGKSSAAITYMNENPDKKYIYITPYLEETERIKNACPALNFYLPPKVDSNKKAFSKTATTLAAIWDGRNIASTHQCFLFYTPEIAEAIRAGNYTLIVDEAVDSLEPVDDTIASPGDLLWLMELGVLERQDDESYVLTEKADSYPGKAFQMLFRILASRRLIHQKHELNADEGFYFWVLSEELIRAFDDVVVMTYMFDSSNMKLMFDIAGLSYENIYVSKESGDEYSPDQYRFVDAPSYVPSYVRELPSLIDIYEHRSTDKGDDLNAVGRYPYSLSSNWQKKSDRALRPLRNNIQNYFTNMNDRDARRRMWSCYSHSESSLKGLGYASRHLAYNARATNKYSQSDILAYAVNIFAHPAVMRYYKNNGVHFDQDRYALSTMIQWIWRSAIRDGKPIHIYVPSKRMRDLLKDWIEETSKMGVSES